MKNNIFKCKLINNKTILSSNSMFYKTERFVKETKYISNIDYLLTKLCETILYELVPAIKNKKFLKIENEFFNISLLENKINLKYAFGYQIGCGLGEFDIVFYGASINSKNQDAQTIDNYVRTKSDINIIISNEKLAVDKHDLAKLYTISYVSNVSLPRLSDEQKAIVETVDKNVLIQGVAGSGKTNICIDKIIYTACKNYSGKVLYTTYSRGLLSDTKFKVEQYKKDLQEMLNQYRNNLIVFLDDNHKKALEDRLGIYFFSDDDNQIFDKIEKIINYLTFKVDYYLIEDLYKIKFNDNSVFVGEEYFVNFYSQNFSNYQIEKSFQKLSSLSKELIFKEIFGVIFGSYNIKENRHKMSLNEYLLTRSNSYSKEMCENIYKVAIDYYDHCVSKNLMDNNIASSRLIDINNDIQYSLSILDEVQDFTQINLYLFKKISLKLFCAGDALQMINPSYFNFGYLKNLIYEENLTEIKELKCNYRNTSKITSIINNLALINRSEFGTHSFIIKSESVNSGLETTSIFVRDKQFINNISKSNFDNFTIVVSDQKQKKKLQQIIKNQEVLTVSEIKGLERNTIIALNLLSDNKDKWTRLEKHKVNHKAADENSVYRYYYNLFYVGLSRAMQNVIVVEDETISQFESFFNKNFNICNAKNALKKLESIVGKVEFSQDELIDRVYEFIKLQQYDNARFVVNKIKDEKSRVDLTVTIQIYESLVSLGKYRDAGVKFWEYGLIDEAQKQFAISGDMMLIEMIDNCSDDKDSHLSVNIVEYYNDVKDNNVARELILETVKKDILQLKNSFKDINKKLIKGDK